jgi:hypothetical protein
MVSNSDPSVLAEATCYYDGRVVLKESICFPICRSIVDPSLVAVNDKPVEVLEVFKVQPDGRFFPGLKDEYTLYWKI